MLRRRSPWIGKLDPRGNFLRKILLRCYQSTSERTLKKTHTRIFGSHEKQGKTYCLRSPHLESDELHHWSFLYPFLNCPQVK